MLPKCAIQEDGSILVSALVPPANSKFVGGIAVSSAVGAMFMTNIEPVEVVYTNGFRVNHAGSIYATEDAIIASYNNGIPMASDGALVITADTANAGDGWNGGVRVKADGGVYHETPTGNNLVTNGGFLTNLLSWTANGWQWIARDVGGAASPSHNTSSTLAQTVAMVDGDSVHLIFEYKISAGGILYIRLGGINLDSIVGPAEGIYDNTLTADGDSITFLSQDCDLGVDYIDDVLLLKLA